MIQKITDRCVEISAFDAGKHPFEGQYPIPEGITYNTWLLDDGAAVLMDTVDAAFTKDWLDELKTVLNGRKLDYLVVSHMEPDHSGSILEVTKAYPEVKLVGNAKTFGMMDQFIQGVKAERVVVKDGETLQAGGISLRFVFAPMVHWPEVMVAYEEKDKTLFAADAFGTFGNGADAGWAEEARRYYGNIVGKYGVQVQNLMKKLSAFDVARICPLHGPVLSDEAMAEALRLYGLWSAWEPESEGTLVVCASFHGNTLAAAEAFCAMAQNEKEAALVDLSEAHTSYAIGQAFKYRNIALFCTTYDGAFAPLMEKFINSMKMKGIQKRRFALVENGSWAPMAAKGMRAALEGMKNIEVLDHQVTIRSSMTEANREELAQLAKEL